MTPELELFGTTFRNPVLLAAGTCGFGREVHRVTDLDRLGGFVTKSVTLEPRHGNPPVRVAEFEGGMLNSIGLTNPGAEAVRDRKLPWIRERVRRARVWISVAGHTREEYVRVVEILDGSDGFLGYEMNLSCPNDRELEGKPFALDPAAVRAVLTQVRSRTDRPVLAKLAPNDPDLEVTIQAAEEAGADGLTLVNTMPGLALDPDSGAPELGAGEGGVSGPALRPLGLRAVALAARITKLPIVGVGGILSERHAREYLAAGASLIQMGTATFADPRAAVRVAQGLERRPHLAGRPSTSVEGAGAGAALAGG